MASLRIQNWELWLERRILFMEWQEMKPKKCWVRAQIIHDLVNYVKKFCPFS